MGWKEKEATGEFTPKGNVDALHMVLGKDHQGRVVGKGGVRVGVKKAFGKEFSTPRSRTMPSFEEVEKRIEEKITAKVTAKVTKDVFDKMASLLQKLGATHDDLANLIAEDQQSQHGDPKALVEPSPEPLTPVAHQPITRSTPEPHIPTPETMNSVTQVSETTPDEPVLKVHLIFKYTSAYLFKFQRVLIIYHDVNYTKRKNF
jgi:hypothetical protein